MSLQGSITVRFACYTLTSNNKRIIQQYIVRSDKLKFNNHTKRKEKKRISCPPPPLVIVIEPFSISNAIYKTVGTLTKSGPLKNSGEPLQPLFDPVGP